MIVEAAEAEEDARPGGVGAATRAGRERRRAGRHLLDAVARYQRLWSVRVLEVGPSGLRVESELPFRFGPGRLSVLRSAGSPCEAELDVVLLWSRLVATERGPFGEICPRFHSGLAVVETSRGAWRRTLRALLGGA